MKGGERLDFDLIYKQYFRDVFLYLRSLSANEDIAEEIAQETFAKALKAIDSKRISVHGCSPLRRTLILQTVSVRTCSQEKNHQKILLRRSLCSLSK